MKARKFKSIVDILSAVQLPIWCLFKNLETGGLDPEEENIRSFAWAEVSQDKGHLRDLIPTPEVPPGEPKILEAFLKHFEYESLAAFEADKRKDMDEFHFDDKISNWDQVETFSIDYRIYGESYTLLWLCPLDKELIVRKLIEEVGRETQGLTKRVDAAILAYIWEEFIDRIHFLTHPPADQPSSANFWQEVTREFQTQVDRLANSPAKEDWDELWRMDS
jgi:hypothetical protein